MSTVAQILRTKPSHAVYTTAPDSTVYEAIAAMAEHGVGALLVVEGERIVGIVTERDYARKIALAGRSSKETAVADVMTTQVLVVSPQQTTEDCMALMTENRLRHLPVLDNGRLVGLVSIGDLVKDIISEQRYIIEQLEHYVSGNL
jgi:CBS domain-containing protein